MNTKTLQSRLLQTAKLRDTCKANGNHDGYLAHDRTLGRLQTLLCQARDASSSLRLNACPQASR